jgi:hypothetical protein
MCGERFAARFQASLGDAVRVCAIDPALETPGYCQRSLRDLRSVPQLRADSIEGCERSDARGPVGTAENSPPVHWRDRAPARSNRAP